MFVNSVDTLRSAGLSIFSLINYVFCVHAVIDFVTLLHFIFFVSDLAIVYSSTEMSIWPKACNATVFTLVEHIHPKKIATIQRHCLYSLRETNIERNDL